MKALVLLLLMALSAFAEQSNIRLVEGKAYDITKSQHWQIFDGRISQVTSNGIILTTENYMHPRQDPPGKQIYIRNYPTNSAATGQKIEGKVMHVGTITLKHVSGGKETIELWDYGTVPSISGKETGKTNAIPSKPSTNGTNRTTGASLTR